VEDAANHDINDAFAVLWTAERIFRIKAEVLPAEADFDSVGLRMGILY
jgi:predicted RNase H-like nuclease